MNLNPKVKDIKEEIETRLSRSMGISAKEATVEQMYKAAAMTVRDMLVEKRIKFRNEVNNQGAKRVYYMCMEFLLGRSLKNNLCNLGLAEKYAKALSELGFDLEKLYDCEPDAGL